VAALGATCIVVNVSGLDATEVLPFTSLTETTQLYRVLGANPVIKAVADDEMPMTAEPTDGVHT
jgi:hypothetical protein